MPCLKVFTNVPAANIPVDFANNMVPILSRTVGKPPGNFIVMVTAACMLHFRGDSDVPSAVATLESIGHIDPVTNKAVVKEVSEYLNKTIGVHPDKFFISFFDLPSSNVGTAGTTVDALEKR